MIKSWLRVRADKDRAKLRKISETNNRCKFHRQLVICMSYAEAIFPTVSASMQTDKSPDSLPISANEGRDTEHLKTGADTRRFRLTGHWICMCVCLLVLLSVMKCTVAERIAIILFLKSRVNDT